MLALRRLIAMLIKLFLGCIVYGYLFNRSMIPWGYSNLACAATGLLCTPSPAAVTGIGHGSGHRQDTTNESLHPLHNALIEKSRRVKKIAFGSSYWGNFPVWGTVFKRFTDGGCPVSSCIVSYDWMDADTADAVVFNAPDITLLFDLPKKNNPAQVWVWFSVEPPPVLNHHTSHFWSFYDVFDWTMTYRLDSDVVMPYGSFIPIDPSTADPTRNRWLEKQSKNQKLFSKTTSGHVTVNFKMKGSNKTSTPPREEVMVSWMASNCNTSSGRENFVKEIQKYIAVDIYGHCGPKQCGERETVGNLEKNKKTYKCLKQMENYHFYLSFENALCKDYVTEKFYKVLKLDVVPVVFGSANYTALAPPNSFINALDFASPKALADYLKEVAASETLYNSFFEWKTKFRVEVGHPYSALVCDLCAKLQGEDTYQGAMIPSPTVDIPRSLNTSSHLSLDWKDLSKLDLSEKSRTGAGPEQPRTAAEPEKPRTVARPERFRPAPRTKARPEQQNTGARRRALDKWFNDDAHCVTWTRGGQKPVP